MFKFLTLRILHILDFAHSEDNQRDWCMDNPHSIYKGYFHHQEKTFPLWRNLVNGKVKLAVIMSIYKNDKIEYVESAVESILNQTYSCFDYFIKCDGPVRKEVNDFLSGLRDDRIHIYRSEKNMGLALSLNDLLEIVKTKEYEFIARMDADDVSIKDRFEKQLAYLEKKQEVDLVGGAINEIDEHGKDKGKVVVYPCSVSGCRVFFAKRNPVAHPAVMFRRSFLDKAGWHYPTDYIRNEDTRMWHEGYKHGCNIANIPDVVLNFRMTDDMFKKRRNGKVFAKSQLKLRKLIIEDLQYGKMAYVYAYAMYWLMLLPSWLLKLAYKILR